MVIDCSQITAVLCDIQILTAVLTTIIVGLLKKRFRGYYNFSSLFRLRVFQNKGNVCIVSLQGISLQTGSCCEWKKIVCTLSKCPLTGFNNYVWEFKMGCNKGGRT